MNATHVDLPLEMISSAISILLAIIGGGVWLGLTKDNRKYKLHAIGITIIIAFAQLFTLPVFDFILIHIDLIPAMLLYIINPLIIGWIIYYLKHVRKY